VFVVKEANSLKSQSLKLIWVIGSRGTHGPQINGLSRSLVLSEIEIQSQERASFVKLRRPEKILVIGVRCTWRQIECGSEFDTLEDLRSVALWVENSRRPE
jgi:hypothetical protein